MVGFAEIFKGVVGGDPIQSITDMIDQFHLSAEQKAQLQQAVKQLELQRAEIEAARDQAVAEIQGQNLGVEARGEDAYVRRARPTFLYVMIGAIGCSIVLFPLLNLATHRGLTLVPIPDAYLELFGVAFLGYTGARTWEKTRGVK